MSDATPRGANEIKLNPATIKAVLASWLNAMLEGGPYEVTEYEMDVRELNVVFKPVEKAEAKS